MTVWTLSSKYRKLPAKHLAVAASHLHGSSAKYFPLEDLKVERFYLISVRRNAHTLVERIESTASQLHCVQLRLQQKLCYKLEDPQQTILKRPLVNFFFLLAMTCHYSGGEVMWSPHPPTAISNSST